MHVCKWCLTWIYRNKKPRRCPKCDAVLTNEGERHIKNPLNTKSFRGER